MSTTSAEAQLGDATVLRCFGAGFLGIGETTVIVHEASSGFMRIGVREDGPMQTARLKTSDLPALLRTLIARSGRTDLNLHHTPSEDTNGKVEVTHDTSTIVHTVHREKGAAQ